MARGSQEKKVAQMYATTGAPLVCVANYSPFGARSLQGKVSVTQAGCSTLYLVDDFKPGATPDDMAAAIRRVVLPPVDVLIDRSGSMSGAPVAEGILSLFRMGATFGTVFHFTETLEAAPPCGHHPRKLQRRDVAA